MQMICKSAIIALASAVLPPLCPNVRAHLGQYEYRPTATGAYAGNTFVLEADRPMTLGRDPAAAQIVFGQAAGKVSGAHCTVTYVASEDRYRVVDLSSNGTYVGSSRLPARTPVLVNRGAELMLADADNVVRLL